MPERSVRISGRIDGRAVDREQISEWESRRIDKAARKIGLPAPTGDLDRRRNAWCDSKLEITAAEVRERLRRDLAFADRTARTTVRLAGGRRSMSVCVLDVTGGDSRSFIDWVDDTERADYTRSMILASPDHFLFQTSEDGSQEVVETTGGSPLASRFFIDYQDLSTLTSRPDQAFPFEIAGIARTADGTRIGGVRHQFRDVDDGFQARLCVEFPRLMPGFMISQHRWHLACEFSNWIEAAFAAG